MTTPRGQGTRDTWSSALTRKGVASHPQYGRPEKTISAVAST